jgi:hypothetical protein
MSDEHFLQIRSVAHFPSCPFLLPSVHLIFEAYDDKEAQQKAESLIVNVLNVSRQKSI